MVIFEANKLLDEIIDLKSIKSIRGGKYSKYISVAVPIFVSVQFICVVLVTFIHFGLNLNVDIHKALPSFGPSLWFFILTMQYWHLLVNRAKFYSLLDDMQTEVNKRKQLDGNDDLYTQTQQQVQFLNKLFSVAFATPLVYLCPFVIVAYHLCIGDYSIDSWILIYPIWTPFETNALSNFFSVVFQISCAACAVTVYYAMLSIFNEFALYSKAFILDIKSMFDHVDRLTKSKKKSDELLMLNCLKEAVDLHETVYRFAHQFADIANWIVLVTVVPLVLVICVSLFAFDKYWRTISTFESFILLLYVFFASQMLFTFYYFGQKVHSDLMALSDMIYQSEWDRHPRSVRRFMLLMMMRAQQPFYLGAYGLIRCTRENYVGVIQWIYSAFMLLRSLD